MQGIYKDVVLGQPTCGHCDEFASTLPRQTTSLYHGPVVINLPGRPASWGIARPENLFRPGGTHFISHSICSVTLSLSLTQFILLNTDDPRLCVYFLCVNQFHIIHLFGPYILPNIVFAVLAFPFLCFKCQYFLLKWDYP